MRAAKPTKNTNQSRILECLYRHPGVSRKDISLLTGITPATVTTTTAAMMKEGLITELGLQKSDVSRSGRGAIALDISADHALTLGVELTLESLSVCAADLKNHMLYAERTPYTPKPDEDIAALVIKEIRRCIKALRGREKDILGIGIAVPGHMDRDLGSLISTNQFWRSFDGRPIVSAFPYPVVFENNVRSMAVNAYLHSPEKTPSSFALFHVGRGMFCANIADDELYIGTTYGSGEIAHILAVPDGKRCECGKRGCLQTVAAEPALLENAALLLRNDPSSPLHNFVDSPEKLTIEHIALSYEASVPEARRMVHQALTYLVMASLNVSILMNPEKLLIHGRLFNHPAVREDFMEMIHDKFSFTGNNYKLGTVEVIDCSPLDGAAGAAALALLRCFIRS